MVSLSRGCAASAYGARERVRCADAGVVGSGSHGTAVAGRSDLGAAASIGGARCGLPGGCRWVAFHGCVGGVEAAVLRRLLDGRPEFHGKRRLRLDLLRFVLATVLGDCGRRLPVLPGLIWRVGMDPGEIPGRRGGRTKVDAPRRRLPSWRLRCGSCSSHLCHERRRKPLFLCLGDDGTLVSCSFLKASAGDCSGWWSCW